MKFVIGILELVGYLVPGAILLVAAFVIQGTLTDAAAISSDPGGFVLLFIASYIAGHVITIMSHTLANVKIIAFGHSIPTFTFYPQFLLLFKQVFGGSFTPREVYHLSRNLVLDRSPRIADHIERLFALVIFTRNMAMATLLLFPLFLWSGHHLLFALSVVATTLFVLQFIRFEETEKKAVINGAFTILSQIKMKA